MQEELARMGIDLDVGLHLRLVALVMARFMGMATPTPFLGGQLLPGRIKFGIPLLFTLFFYPFLQTSVDPARVPELGVIYFAYFAKEILIGYVIGFVISLPFHAIDAAGSFMDTQRGTTFAQVISPMLGGQASLLGQFLNLLFLVIFLSMGGLQIVLVALADSYDVFPLMVGPQVMHPNAALVTEIIAHTAQLFVVAVQLSMPVVVCMFLTDVTLGIINRAAPNVQVFFLGMGLKAVGGLVVVLVGFELWHASFAELIIGLSGQIQTTLRALAAT